VFNDWQYAIVFDFMWQLHILDFVHLSPFVPCITHVLNITHILSYEVYVLPMMVDKGKEYFVNEDIG
jgi:hypothetical protein